MDSITGANSNLTSLYHPSPASHMQANLAQYYERTSRFVGEQFKQLVDTPDVRSKYLNKATENGSDGGKTRLKPKGLGQLVDMYV